MARQAAGRHLQASYTRIDGHFAELRQWATSMDDARAMHASFMQTEVFQDFLVNGIAPGAILWPENPASADASAQQKILHSIALGRLGAVEEIARLTRFLLTDATYVTGQVIAVDGGAHLALATA